MVLSKKYTLFQSLHQSFNPFRFAVGFFLLVVFHSEPRSVAAQHAELLGAVTTTDITPPVGYRHGGGYNEVISTGVHDPLYAKAIVLRQEQEAFVLVECDLLSVPLAISSQIRKAASIETNIPVSNIVIAATHNHGSPEYWGPLRDLFHEQEVSLNGKDIRESIDYPQVLVSRIVRAISSASNTCMPVTADLTVARQEGLAFNRRFHMTDGSVLINPGKRNKSIVRPAGPVDEDLPFLLFRDANDGTPKFSFCIFAMHTAVFGGTEFGSDFPGHLQKALEAKFGKEFVSLFGEGCAGDVNHIDVRNDQPQPSSTEPMRVASILFKTIDTNREHARKIDLFSLKSKSRTVAVGIVAASEIKLEQSKSLLLNQSSNGALFLDLVDAWRNWHAWHERLEHGNSKPLEVQALRLSNDLAIVFLPHEVFVELGMAIKSSSPFRNTVVVSLANDVDYYIPTRKAFEEGSYEVTTCPLTPGCGEKLVSLSIDMLNELKSELKLSHE